jgi:membrane protease YdiL (CAAX protease family)
MRPLWALVIYIVVVFFGGALLAPWLYWLAQHFAQAFPKLANAPFHRFVDRSFLILALAGVWPLLRALGAKSLREIGLVPPYGQSKKLFGGLLLGFVSLAVVAGIVLFSGGRALTGDASAGKIIGTVLGAAGTAVVVATLEEILFRGGVFGGLRRMFYWPLALVLSSLIYALVHFLSPADLAGPVAWYSGLALLPRLLGGLASFHALVPAFLSLTLVGVLLGLAYQRTGTLYFSIGLHAGWVFWLKAYGTFTAGVPNSAAWFWGTGKMTDGWLAFLVLALTLAVINHVPAMRKRQAFAIPS